MFKLLGLKRHTPRVRGLVTGALISNKPKIMSDLFEYPGNRFNRRHRKYGKPLKATDIDMVEYHHRTPVAIYEIKKEDAESYPAQRAIYKHIGEALGIPAWVLRFYPSPMRFRIKPLNEDAYLLFPQRRVYAEDEFIKILYGLRGLTPPVEVLKRAATTKKSKGV